MTKKKNLPSPTPVLAEEKPKAKLEKAVIHIEKNAKRKAPKKRLAKKVKAAKEKPHADSAAEEVSHAKHKRPDLVDLDARLTAVLEKFPHSRRFVNDDAKFTYIAEHNG
jgi:hypothetical protein